MQARYEWHVASGVPVSHQEPRTARGLRIQAAAADLRITGSGSACAAPADHRIARCYGRPWSSDRFHSAVAALWWGSPK